MPDYRASYEARVPFLDEVRRSLEQAAVDALDGTKHIDRISFRVKGVSSFLGKLEQKPDAYDDPLTEVEDQIAGRVLVFFRSDVQVVVDALKRAFGAPLESAPHEPEAYAEFGYESYHEVYSIPAWSYPDRLA